MVPLGQLLGSLTVHDIEQYPPGANFELMQARPMQSFAVVHGSPTVGPHAEKHTPKMTRRVRIDGTLPTMLMAALSKPKRASAKILHSRSPVPIGNRSALRHSGDGVEPERHLRIPRRRRKSSQL